MKYLVIVFVALSVTACGHGYGPERCSSSYSVHTSGTYAPQGPSLARSRTGTPLTWISLLYEKIAKEKIPQARIERETVVTRDSRSTIITDDGNVVVVDALHPNQVFSHEHKIVACQDRLRAGQRAQQRMQTISGR